ALVALHRAATTAAAVVGAEGGDFHQVAAHVDMDDLEAATDDAGAPEQGLDFLGGGVGGHVEVLGVATEEDVADAAARHIGLELVLLKHVYDLARATADIPGFDGVLAGLEDMGANRWGAGFPGGEDLDQPFQHRVFSSEGKGGSLPQGRDGKGR